MDEIIHNNVVSNDQLTDFAVEISKEVMEIMYNKMKYLDSESREINEAELMEKIPVIITNMIQKTPIFRTPSGFDKLVERKQRIINNFVDMLTNQLH